MLKKLSLFFLVLAPSNFSFADEGPAYIFSDPIVVGNEGGDGGQDVEAFFEDSSRFNYYENQSLRAFSSLFVEGVDQRFLDFQYNGFSLRDPSNPTGVFNVSAVSGLQGVKLRLHGSSALSVENKEEEKKAGSLSYSNLNEFGVNWKRAKCSLAGCFSLSSDLKRGGGFSALEGGREDDFFEELTLSLSKSFFRSNKDFTTHILYYGQRLDQDAIEGLNSLAVESLDAEALNSIFFIGQDIVFNDQHSLKLSHTSSYRNQRDTSFSFRQRGEVFELGYSFMKAFEAKFFHERYNLYSTKDKDNGFLVKKKFKIKPLKLSLSAGKTRLRTYNWNAEVGFKNFVVFYKGQPASLFQKSFNDRLEEGGVDLDSQETLGLRYVKKKAFKFFDLKFNLSYLRLYRFIDFNSSLGAYKNLREVENLFVGLTAKRGPLRAFVQRQVARQVNGSKQQLARRPDWTLGLKYKKKITRDFGLSANLKWVSERKAFNQTDLEATWLSGLELEYKNFKLNCTNVLSRKEAVFKRLTRRPLTLRLSYQKNF